VDEAARFLVESILANDRGLMPYEESNGDQITLDQETVAERKSGCC